MVDMGGLKRVLDYVNVIIWVMLSGSVVMLMHGDVFIPLVLVFFVIQMMFRFKRYVKLPNIIALLFLMGTYLINYLLYWGQCWGPQQYFVNVLLAVSSFAFAELISEHDFSNIYVNVMIMLSIYSLIMYSGGLLFRWDSLAVSRGNIKCVGLHNYWAFSVGRNSGCFWEPGGFQIFLNLALIFSISNHSVKATTLEWLKRIILIVTIITTRSTAGFILMAIICIYMLRKMLNNVHKRKLILFSWILYCLVVLGILAWLFSSDAVQNKLFMPNGSTAMRWGDFTGSFWILSQVPIYGVGVNTAIKDNLLGNVGIVNNSVGILASSINYGICYMIIYVFIILRNVRTTHFLVTKYSFLLLVFIVITSLTQSAFEFPVMYMFLFQFAKQDVKFRVGYI